MTHIDAPVTHIFLNYYVSKMRYNECKQKKFREYTAVYTR